MKSGISFFFFFSSRRRHTRWNCDWSSDVCSSDLGVMSGPGHTGWRESEPQGLKPDFFAGANAALKGRSSTEQPKAGEGRSATEDSTARETSVNPVRPGTAGSDRHKLATRLVNFDACPEDPFRPVATPIYQTATFEQESAVEFGRYDYSRSGNPTRTVLEDQVA